MSDKAKQYIKQQMSYGSLGNRGFRWIAEIEENERVAKLASRLFSKTVHELIELVDKQAQTAALVEAAPRLLAHFDEVERLLSHLSCARDLDHCTLEIAALKASTKVTRDQLESALATGDKP